MKAFLWYFFRISRAPKLWIFWIMRFCFRNYIIMEWKFFHYCGKKILTKQTQVCPYFSARATMCPITKGAPQGSILRPLPLSLFLFTLMTRSVANTKFKFSLNGYDTNIFFKTASYSYLFMKSMLTSYMLMTTLH